MDAFKVLEQKLVTLAGMVKDLKVQNNQLQTEKDKLLVEYDDIKAENAKLAEEVAQLSAKLETLEGSMLKGSEQIAAMSQEKQRAKLAVDELIKSIDSLVNRENQQ